MVHYNTKTQTSRERFKMPMRCDMLYGILNCTEQSMLRKGLVIQMIPKAHTQWRESSNPLCTCALRCWTFCSSQLPPLEVCLFFINWLYSDCNCVSPLSYLFWNTRTCNPSGSSHWASLQHPDTTDKETSETEIFSAITELILKVMWPPVISWSYIEARCGWFAIAIISIFFFYWKTKTYRTKVFQAPGESINMIACPVQRSLLWSSKFPCLTAPTSVHFAALGWSGPCTNWIFSKIMMRQTMRVHRFPCPATVGVGSPTSGSEEHPGRCLDAALWSQPPHTCPFCPG